VPGVHAGTGETASIVQVFCSANRPVEMMTMWVRMLALCAAGKLQVTDAWSIGKNPATPSKSFAYVAKFALAGFGRPAALAALEQLVVLYDEACTEPRPMFGGTAEKLMEGRAKAVKEFESFRRRLKPYHAEDMVYGERLYFNEIYPSGKGNERFFRALFGLRKRTINVGNDRAHAAARQRKQAK